MRALIMAGGADEKWTNLGGTGRRHFQLVCGERVIDRIARQLKERGVTDIYVIHPGWEEYFIEGTEWLHPTYDAWGHEALNGRDHWSDTDRTLQVYGDLIATDAAMDTIVGFSARKWQMFGRYGNGVIKGGGGELFATSFWPEHRDEWEAAQREAIRLHERGIVRRVGSWTAYRIMAGARGRRAGLHRFYPSLFTQINDRLTDDFDTPKQFEALRALFESEAARSDAARRPA